MSTKQQYYGTGRRKTSTARVYLRPGNGAFIVNRTEIDSYFNRDSLKLMIRQPLEHTNTTPKSIYEWYLKEHNRLQQYRRLSIESVIDECKCERDEIIAQLGMHRVGGNRE